jgi:hypothetical protein
MIAGERGESFGFRFEAVAGRLVEHEEGCHNAHRA